MLIFKLESLHVFVTKFFNFHLEGECIAPRIKITILNYFCSELCAIIGF